MKQTQVVIVGAGPIGLELAANLKALGVAYEHIEAGQVGQTITWYPRQARFFSSPDRIALADLPLVTTDQTKATREEYLSYLRAFVRHFDLEVRTYERVAQIEPLREGGFLVHTSRGVRGEVTQCKQIVLAIGDMHRPRYLRIPGEDLPHVSHYFEEPHQYFRKRLLIIGGANSAVEAALRCHHAGATVTISYRQPAFDERSVKYWLLPELRSLIKHEQIAFHPCTWPVCIEAGRVQLAPSHTPACQACPGTPAEKFYVDTDFVLALTGYVMDTTLLEQTGVRLEGENRAPVVDLDTMQTNVPGLYIAGTAAAGTQIQFRLFIENCHAHVCRIVRSITGRDPAPGLINQTAKTFGLAES